MNSLTLQLYINICISVVSFCFGISLELMASCRKVIERSICLTQLSQHQCFFTSLMTTAANTRCTETLLILNSHEMLNSLCASSVLGFFHTFSISGAHPGHPEHSNSGSDQGGKAPLDISLPQTIPHSFYCAMRQGLLQFILPQP